MTHYDKEIEQEKNIGGRPLATLTPEQVNEVKVLSAVLSKNQLADYFDVCANTFRAIEERQPEVAAAYKVGRSRAIATVGSNLITQAKSGNTAAAIFYLKTQAGWKETTHIQQETKEVKTFSDMYED